MSTVQCEIFSVAFNKPHWIREQIRLFKKFADGRYRLTVVDQSTDDASAKEIFHLCMSTKTPMLFRNQTEHSPSVAHGNCLNWIYSALNTDAPYFGFIDHDTFPLAPLTIIEHLEKTPLYGLMQRRQFENRDGTDIRNYWYLFANFCFFKRSRLAGIPMDFKPVPGVMDTGGGNWETLYRTAKKDEVGGPSEAHVMMREGPIQTGGYAYYYHETVRYREWLHAINGSGWFGGDAVLAANKEKRILEILARV